MSTGSRGSSPRESFTVLSVDGARSPVISAGKQTATRRNDGTRSERKRVAVRAAAHSAPNFRQRRDGQALWPETAVSVSRAERPGLDQQWTRSIEGVVRGSFALALVASIDARRDVPIGPSCGFSDVAEDGVKRRRNGQDRIMGNKRVGEKYMRKIERRLWCENVE